MKEKKIQPLGVGGLLTEAEERGRESAADHRLWERGSSNVHDRKVTMHSPFHRCNQSKVRPQGGSEKFRVCVYGGGGEVRGSINRSARHRIRRSPAKKTGLLTQISAGEK